MKKNYLKNLFFGLFTVLLLAGTFVACSDSDDDPSDPIKAELAELNEAIKSSQALLDAPTVDEDYPANAISDFKKVVDAGKAVQANDKATQAQVDAIVVQLNKAKESFLAAAYGAIPDSALLMGLTFDEEVNDNKIVTAGKGWVAELAKGPSEIFNADTGFPTFVTGKIGKAIRFEKGSHLEVNDYSSADLLSSQLSVATWVKPDSTRAGNYIISYNYWNSFKFQLQEQNKPFFTIHTNEDGWVDADNEHEMSAPNNEWTHLVVTLNLNTKKIAFYVDGALTKEWDDTTKEGLKGTGAYEYETLLPLMIGACTTYAEADAEWDWEWSRTPDGWDHFVGLMDEFKLYNIALDEGQVAKLFRDENI